MPRRTTATSDEAAFSGQRAWLPRGRPGAGRRVRLHACPGVRGAELTLLEVTAVFRDTLASRGALYDNNVHKI